MKRAIAPVAALCLLAYSFSFAALCASQYGDFSYTVLDGARVRIDCFNNRNAASAVIPESIDGYPVTEIGAQAFKQKSSLTSVVIPDSVISIGNDAFSYCLKLSSVRWGSVKSLGDAAFSECRALGNIDLNSADTLGERCFFNCTGLKSADLGERLTVLPRNTFSGCTALQTVVFSPVLKSIEAYAFSGCEALLSVSFPNTLTTVGDNAFYECAALENVTFGKGGMTLGVYAFLNCESLLSVTVPPNVTAIGKYAFALASGNEFSHAEGFTITCQNGSAAYNYCKQYGLTPKLKNFNTLFMVGDVNGDGGIGIDDAIKILRVAATLDPFDDNLLYYYDYDGSKTVDVRDARLVLRKAAGLS